MRYRTLSTVKLNGWRQTEHSSRDRRQVGSVRWWMGSPRAQHGPNASMSRRAAVIESSCTAWWAMMG